MLQLLLSWTSSSTSSQNGANIDFNDDSDDEAEKEDGTSFHSGDGGFGSAEGDWHAFILHQQRHSPTYQLFSPATYFASPHYLQTLSTTPEDLAL
ncbi:hypothetical protein AC579_1926 [Pseudocercospora musae]|uniref:Uncharacterized protein n=1 Tax=Pseudocercospora musae TaxID=113226 RepID=A0A139HFP4_9PEZI|nr:hypothetical protein AC579_1926 [Pseudocercospora musae]